MKLLHLSHHRGCLEDIEYVGDRLGIAVRSATFDDGYNIGVERAERAWARWRDRILDADVVLTSDTAPLARIVLQHMDEFPGRLVIWVCNRFDYFDAATNDCGFPDRAYYDIFRGACAHTRVDVAAFTAFEAHYARTREVELGGRIIKPLGRKLPRELTLRVPATVDRAKSVFVPPYHNDTILVDLREICVRGGVPAYRGRYGSIEELRDFRAIVHIPYSWSTFALFEAVQQGIPMLIPSARFLLELAHAGEFWWPNRERLDELLSVSEWYLPGHDFLVTFESWSDLREKLERTDLAVVRERTTAFAERHERATLAAWESVLTARA